MSRSALLSDAQWTRIVPLMPSLEGQRGRPFRDHRQVVEATVSAADRGGLAGSARDVRAVADGVEAPQAVQHGTWDKVPARLVAEADAAGDVDWKVSVDSTINGAHQHATSLSRVEEPAGRRAKAITGAEPNYKDLRAEPPDHALGSSRGGFSTKIHQLVDGQRASAGRGADTGTDRRFANAATAAGPPRGGLVRAPVARAPVLARCSATRPTLAGYPDAAACQAGQDGDPAAVRSHRPPQTPR